MRSTSNLWKKIAAKGDFGCETKLVIGNTEYIEITAPTIDRNTMPAGLSVGNCCCASMQVSIKTNDTIPKGAEVDVYSRITNKHGTSEWLQMGRFYISRRSRTYDGMLDLVCYDDMLKANKKITSADMSSWGNSSKTPQQAVNWIAAKLGVSVDSRISLAYNTMFIGFPENKTYKELLSAIAGEHGGNFHFTHNGELMLCPLTSIPDESFFIVSNEFEIIGSEEGDNLVWQESEGNPSASVVNVPVVLGELNTGNAFTLEGVKTVDTWGEENTAGEVSDASRTLLVDNNFLIAPYNAVATTRRIWENNYQIGYAPYTATRCVVNPAIEVGDQIKIGSAVLSVVYNMSITLGDIFTVDLSVPDMDEDEYPYLGSENASASNFESKVKKVSVGSDTVNISASSNNDDIIFTTATNQTSVDDIISRIAALENNNT